MVILLFFFSFPFFLKEYKSMKKRSKKGQKREVKKGKKEK